MTSLSSLQLTFQPSTLFLILYLNFSLLLCLFLLSSPFSYYLSRYKQDQKPIKSLFSTIPSYFILSHPIPHSPPLQQSPPSLLLTQIQSSIILPLPTMPISPNLTHFLVSLLIIPPLSSLFSTHIIHPLHIFS